MNAGDINIAITADLRRFEASMDAVRAEAGETAMTAGKFFREKFASELSPQKLGKILGAAIGINFADSMVRNITTAIKNDTSIAEALGKQITSLPVLGSLISLGEALEERMSGRAQDRAEGLARQLNDAALAEEYARADKAFADEFYARQATEERIRKIRSTIESEQLELGIQNARSLQDEEEAIRLDFIKRMKQIEKETATELLKASTDEEKNAILDLDAVRRAVARAGMEEERRQYEEKKEKERKDSLEQIQQEAQQREEERKETLEKLLAEREKLMDQQAASITAGIGSAQTGLGAFRFDAYPDSAKRKNDETTNKLLGEISDKISDNGGFV